MYFHLVDYTILVVVVVALFGMALYTRRYSRSVADFLVANRCAGRYLIAVASVAAGVGAITIIAGMEVFHVNGFSAVWWGLLPMVIGMVVSLSGWVHYRYRETRAMTLAQFVEMRYSRNLRIFMGMIAFISGIVNFGIFPSVISRFLIYFIGLPDNIYVFMIIMGIIIGISLIFTFIGGQVTILVTDFMQGILLKMLYVAVPVFLFFVVGWDRIIETLSTAPQGASLLDPFDTAQSGNFNIFYYALGAFLTVYATGAWQGAAGYNAAAINAHEARMAQILNRWRRLPERMLTVFGGICAYTIMRHPDFVLVAQNVNATLQAVANPYLQEQITPSATLQQILPRGLLGFVATAMFCASLSTHNTSLHSWGSIFIQDVVIPFRNKRLTPTTHLRLLRISICGVAVFIFFFSLLFRQIEYIMMFFRITGAIYIGGAGAVIIGGLYWKKGTIAAAWTAMITGSGLSILSIIIKQMHETNPFANDMMAYIASQNSNTLSAAVILLAITLYVVISIISRESDFNLDRMLHRGQYAVSGDQTKKSGLPVRGFKALIGVTDQFTKSDRIFYYLSVLWSLGWAVIFVFAGIYHFMFGIDEQSWISFWFFYVVLLAIVGTIFFLGMAIGGIRDVKMMFVRLNAMIRDDSDDGTVVNHHNLSDEMCQEQDRPKTEKPVDDNVSS